MPVSDCLPHYPYCSFSLRIYLPVGVTFSDCTEKGSSSLCFADNYLLTNLCSIYLSSRAFPFSAVFLAGTLCIPMILLLFYGWLFHHPGLWRTTIKRLMRYGLVITDKQLLLESQDVLLTRWLPQMFRTSVQKSEEDEWIFSLLKNQRDVVFQCTRQTAWQSCTAMTHKQAFPFQQDFGGVYLVHHFCTSLQYSLYCEEFLLITLNPKINTQHCKGCLQTCRCNYWPVPTQSPLASHSKPVAASWFEC